MNTLLPRLLTACGCLCAAASLGNAQTFAFTTIAGSMMNYGANDGTNGDAQFEFPSGLTVDSTGNVFVADTSNNTIRKITPAGSDWLVKTIAGFPALGGGGGTNDGANGKARFWRPNGVVAAPDGKLFVVDHYNHTVRQITPSGTNWLVSTIAGRAGVRGYANGPNSDARFWSPTGIALDQAGNLYVADTETFTIRKVERIGTNWEVSTIAGSAFIFGYVDDTNTYAQFNYPYGIAVDQSNQVYVADYGNHAIRKISPVGNNWVVTTVAGAGVMGNLDGTNKAAQFNFPADVAVDAAGNLFVVDQGNYTIRKIVRMGRDWVTRTIGGLPQQRGWNNGVGSDARFDKPWGIALDHQGNLYVADWRNSTIRMGVPSSSVPPPLHISLVATQVVLSWPLSASNFRLGNSAEPLPGAVWSTLTNGIQISGNSFVMTNQPSVGMAYYRLAK